MDSPCYAVVVFSVGSMLSVHTPTAAEELCSAVIRSSLPAKDSRLRGSKRPPAPFPPSSLPSPSLLSSSPNPHSGAEPQGPVVGTSRYSRCFRDYGPFAIHLGNVKIQSFAKLLCFCSCNSTQTRCHGKNSSKNKVLLTHFTST